MGRQSFVGSPQTVAATINDFVQADASDGFIRVPHITPGGLDPFVDQVVPLLQERGVFRAEYSGTTLRDHLGLGPLRNANANNATGVASRAYDDTVRSARPRPDLVGINGCASVAQQHRLGSAGAHLERFRPELVADRVETQFVGTAVQVADQLERLRDATEADELIVTTITQDHGDRVHSYRLLAEEWARR